MSDATAKTLSDIKRKLCGVILGKDEALDHVLVALLAGRPTGDTPLTRLSGKLRLTRRGKQDEEEPQTRAAASSTAAPADPEQMWEFRTEHGDVATADCQRGTCTARSWTLLSQASFGCTLELDFDVQFSGSEVRLLAFRKSADSDCSGTTVEGSGSGTADASYPDATRAEGTCQLGYTLPGRNDRRATPRRPVTGPVLASVVGTLRLVAGLTGSVEVDSGCGRRRQLNWSD